MSSSLAKDGALVGRILTQTLARRSPNGDSMATQTLLNGDLMATQSPLNGDSKATPSLLNGDSLATHSVNSASFVRPFSLVFSYDL